MFDRAAGLAALVAEARTCVSCALADARTQVVPGEGPACARGVVIGEAPGRQEDTSGRPFVGAAGDLLDRLLRAVDLPRDTLYVTNLVTCRPPRNRDPAPGEIQACTDRWLRPQLALLAPRAILVLGSFASRAFTGEPVSRARGRWHAWEGIPCYVTWHPAHVLVQADEDPAVCHRVMVEMKEDATRFAERVR